MGSVHAVVETPSPDLKGFVKADYVTNDFEALIQTQGYAVYLEKAFPCPCRVLEAATQPRADCKNCAGSGWVFINKTKTRMIMRSMNMNTQFKEWSKENIGTSSLTAREVDEVSFMDRITVIDGKSIHHQILKVAAIDQIQYVMCSYVLRAALDVFVFVDSASPLHRLLHKDYSIDQNRIIFTPGAVATGAIISVKYAHAPQFYVIDLVRETMAVDAKDAQNKRVTVLMPISAVARRSHYVLDLNGLWGGNMWDNSYLPACEI